MKKDPTDTIQKLLVLYLLDEISGTGRATVDAWLQESEENRAWYESLRKTWAETGRVDPEEVRYDAEDAWDRMLRKVEKVEKVFVPVGASRRAPVLGDAETMPTSRRTPVLGDAETMPTSRRTPVLGEAENMPSSRRAPVNRIIRIITSIAAILILGIVSVIFIRNLKDRDETEFITLASAETVVLDTLTDGSTVMLNSNTELSVPKKFTGTTRSVKLKGEAFFQVEPDSLKPFIIDAGLGRVTVLGTSFHVKAVPGSDLLVFVESGRVEVCYADPVTGDTLRTILKTGERAMVKSGTGEIGKPADIGPDELFWANRKLIFQETRLSVVFNLLKKHYKADIGVEDETVLDCLLSATFTDETIDQILEVVATTFDLELSREKDTFIIKGKGCTDEEE
jgi:transmembrane sensor